MADKTAPAGPLREPLPPIYPIPLVQTSVSFLAAMASLKASGVKVSAVIADALDEAGETAVRIIRDGLASHELAVQEGRSRG